MFSVELRVRSQLRPKVDFNKRGHSRESGYGGLRKDLKIFSILREVLIIIFLTGVIYVKSEENNQI